MGPPAPGIDPAASELVEGEGAEGVLSELLLEPRRGDGVRGVKVVLLFFGAVDLGSLASVFLDDDADTFREVTDRFVKGVAEFALDEGDRVPRLAAAEALEEAAVLVDVEARRLLLMEGAEPRPVSTALLECGDALEDEGGDVGAVADEGDGLGGDPGERSGFYRLGKCRVRVRRLGARIRRGRANGTPPRPCRQVCHDHFTIDG